MTEWASGSCYSARLGYVMEVTRKDGAQILKKSSDFGNRVRESMMGCEMVNHGFMSVMTSVTAEKPS